MEVAYENREKLIEIAKREFLEKGFNKASLRKIAADAGVTTGAIYFFFKDKNGLFGAIVGEPLQKILGIMKNHFAEENAEDFTSYVREKGDHDFFAEEIIPVMYDNYDACVILLSKAEGSAYEHVLENMIDMMDASYLELAKKYAAAIPGKKVNEYILHWFSHVQINAFTHLLLHEPDRDRALKEIKPMLDYLVAGWMEYVLEDE